MTPSLATFEPRSADALAFHFAALAIAAGAIAMEVLARPTLDARAKQDRSPVTEADERIEAFVLAELARALPGVPRIAEEAAARGDLASLPDHDAAFLLIDPVDGTREFLSRSPDFTINIALAQGGAPYAGAVYAPAQSRVWFAGERAFEVAAAPGGALPASQDWRFLRARARPAVGLVALISKSHLDPQTREFLAGQHIAAERPMGSSVKFCLLANGEADVYPRFGPTMEWDTAAGDAVLRAAGGATLNPDGTLLRYGKSAQGFRNGAFIAWADPH